MSLGRCELSKPQISTTPSSRGAAPRHRLLKTSTITLRIVSPPSKEISQPQPSLYSSRSTSSTPETFAKAGNRSGDVGTDHCAPKPAEANRV